MDNLYKLIPPPPCGSINMLNKESEINEQEFLQQIDIDDESFRQLLQNIYNSYKEANSDFFYDEMKNICKLISDKKIPRDFSYFHQYHIIDIIFDICNNHQIEDTIGILDLVFCLMHTLTKNSYYRDIFPFELIIKFIDIFEIYDQFNWYFKLLSNYVLEPIDFNPSYLISILNNIQNVAYYYVKVLNVLEFLKELSRFKFVSKESETDSDILLQISRNILLIINYCIGTVRNSKKEEKSPVIESMSYILERLARNRQIDMQILNLKDFKKFIRQNYVNHPKFIKMIGYIYYNYHQNIEVSFAMIASHVWMYKLNADENKYSLWTLYNLIKIDQKSLFEDDSDEFHAYEYISEYILDDFDSLPYYIKRQATLLLSLMYSIIPLSIIQNEEILENILKIFLIFVDDKNDSDMIENIFNSLVNIYQLLNVSKNSIKSDSLIQLFHECKDSLKPIYIDTNNENYEILQKMV